ncbi:hypothetical protein [Fodinibius sediminis]|uniref:DUF3021 domain-containing protein n=1 Tax=Fodinibius sediminis TaxID=1214077 RepID=A0A521AB97_9BACT|nr:hypothetical protein [Fodinibius sediminis]SMO32056.1 hypothetical protein SAMN06265218_10122 [Fodinibius sediminis]
MNNWQRTFAFISGSLVIGLLLIVVSHDFIRYVDREDTAGYLFLLGFGLVYLNLNFGISRRFVIKAVDMNWICYLMAALTIIPTLFWIYTKDVGLGQSQLLFTVITIFSAYLGTYFGIRRGLVKRDLYIQQLRDEEREMPDSLKRPHDDLSKN